MNDKENYRREKNMISWFRKKFGRKIKCDHTKRNPHGYCPGIMKYDSPSGYSADVWVFRCDRCGFGVMSAR